MRGCRHRVRFSASFISPQRSLYAHFMQRGGHRPPVCLRTAHGHPTHTLWAPYGRPTDAPKTPHEHSKGTPHAAHGHATAAQCTPPEETSWTYHRHTTGTSGTARGCPTEAPPEAAWATQRRPMDPPWVPHGRVTDVANTRLLCTPRTACGQRKPRSADVRPPQGHSMGITNAPWAPRTPHRHLIRTPRTPHGHYPGTRRTRHGQLMDSSRTLLGTPSAYPASTSWATHGQSTDSSRTPHGEPTNTPRTVHRRSTNASRAPHG